MRAERTGRDLARRIAPHVEAAWTEQLLLELRLRDVQGAAIGAALAEVESHCAESGEPASVAFGDPVAYARALDLAPTAREPWPRRLDALGPTLVQTVGMLLVVWSIGPVRAGTSMPLSAGRLCVAAMLAAALAVLVARGTAVLRLVVRHPVATWVTLMAMLGLDVVVLLALTDPVAVAPAVPVLVAGVALLAAATAWALAPRRVTAGLDPVTAPLPTPGRARDAGPLARAGGPLLIPLATVVLVALAWATATG